MNNNDIINSTYGQRKRVDIRLPNGSHYVGEMYNGERDGYGTHTLPDGSICKGQWKDNKMVEGVTIWSDGEKYEGQWRNSLKHGYGKYYFRNGFIYEGQYENDLFNGRGKFTNGQTGIAIECYWSNGKKCGMATTIIFPNGQKVEAYIDNRFDDPIALTNPQFLEAYFNQNR